MSANETVQVGLLVIGPGLVTEEELALAAGDIGSQIPLIRPGAGGKPSALGAERSQIIGRSVPTVAASSSSPCLSLYAAEKLLDTPVTSVIFSYERYILDRLSELPLL
jgi:hypothetical protein